MIFDINLNSYCLTIDDEKYNYLCYQFKSHSLTPPTKYRGLKGNCPVDYVSVNTFALISVIEHARQMNLPYVVFFEDDAIPVLNILSRLISIYESVKDIDIDVLYLGRNGDASLYDKPIETFHSLNPEYKNSYSKLTFVNDDLCKIDKNVFGNHAYVVFKSAYEKTIRYMIDCYRSFNMCYADIYLSSAKNLNIYHVTDPLFYQYDFKSNKITTPSIFREHIGFPDIYTYDNKNII